MGYFTSEKLNEYVTRIQCPGNVYAYLVEGKESAALIDTGCGVGSLKAYVESITRLPYVVLLTHGHVDHASGAGEFEQVYLNEKDWELAERHTKLKKRIQYMGGDNSAIAVSDYIEPPEVGRYIPLVDGQSFKLGGVTVTMIALPGHTEGSMCALVEEVQAVLLGDACNSFGYLQLPESTSVEKYRNSLVSFREHMHQFEEVWYSHPHNWGGKEIIDATIALCEELISGKCVGIPLDEERMKGMALLWEDAEKKPEYLWIAKPTDVHDRPLDGSVSNFLYKYLS